MKKWFYIRLTSLIEALEKLREKNFSFIEKAENELQLTHLNRLTDLPENELKQNQTHIDSLYWGIQEPDVYNIALSGGFGTGKSTIISQLIKQKKLSNYQIISLGEFGEKIENERKERIEYSILEQLIFAVKAKDVPDSKINRIIQTRWIGWKSIGIILFIYSVIYLFFDEVNNLIPSIPSWLNFEEIKWFWFIVFVLGLFFLIKKIYRSILDYRVSKISLSDIEISDSKNSSNPSVPLLNQYYDEILYYFVKTRKRILFIEDLDRFKHSRFIYNKLREINTLLNHSSEFKNDKITFVYAIKNNFIGDATQTNKFFELVIPVLPFMSYKTSRDFFIRELEKSKSGEKVGEELENLIYLISPFIFDVRTIYSIVNDFKITKENFNTPDKAPLDTEILALSIYKTVLNEDYDLLLSRKGILFNLFQYKSLIQNEKIREYENKIEDCEKNIKKIEVEFPKSLEKLRKLFLGELSRKLQGSEYLKDTSFDKLLIETAFEDYYNKSIVIRNSHNSLIREVNGFQELEKDVGFNYFERKKRILDKGNTEKKNIKEYQQQIFNIKSKSVQELLENDIFNYWKSVLLTSDLNINLKTRGKLIEILSTDEDFVVKKRKVVESLDLDTNDKDKAQLVLFNNAQKILQVLILNGYINENYINLLSYSHDVYLDSDTYIYYQKIMKSEMPDKDYLLKVDQVKKLIKELRPMYFAKPAILNFSIVHELLISSEDNPIKLHSFISQFEKNSIHLKHIFTGIFHKEEFDERQRFLFTIELLKANYFWTQLQYIKDNELQNNITSYIINKYDKIESKLSDAEFENFKIKLTDFIKEDESVLNKADNIDSLDILNELNYKIKKTHLLENHIKNIVFDKKLFEVNENNLTDCMRHNNHSGGLNVGNINNLYSAYKEVWGLDAFSVDVKTIIDIIVNNDDPVIEKSENALELVLNSENLELDQKKSYIHKVDFELSDISEVDNQELWETIVRFNRIQPKWNNVYQYFIENNLDDSLINFVIHFSNELNSDEFNFIEENAEVKLLKALLKNEEIVHKKIFDKSFICIDNIGFLESQQDLIGYFIDRDFIEINRSNFDYLSEKNKLKLIDKYFDYKYEDNTSFFKKLNITFEDIKNLYLKITNSKAKVLLTEYLIQHNLQGIDLAYNKRFSESFVKSLFEVNNEMITYIVVEHVLLSESIDLNSKIELTTYYLKQENIEESEISDTLYCLGNKYKKLSSGVRTHFENNKLNTRLLNQLYNINYIDEPKLISDKKKISVRKV